MIDGLRLYKDDETPLYVQLADALRARMLGGDYRPGDRLPSVRRLSDELGVNPATIVAAYRILTREGYMASRAGSGAFVADNAPLEAPSGTLAPALAPAAGSAGVAARMSTVATPAAAPVPAAAPAAMAYAVGSRHGPGSRALPLDQGQILDLSANAPPLDLFPLADMKRFLSESIDADGGRAFEYEDTAGYGPLKKTLALRLGTALRGAPLEADDVHIVSGAQQGIDLAARVLLRRGDVAAVECPGYRGARDAFIAAGARVEPVPLLPGGLDLEALERLAVSRPLRLVHINPDFQNPSGIEYGAGVRAELAAMAARHGFYIIEDDLFSDLAWDGSVMPSVRSFDQAGRVVLVKSFSKTLMPGLRIACLEAPPALRQRFELAKRSIDISTNGLMQRVLERFITSGRFDCLLETARRRYLEAYTIFDAALTARATGLSWERPRGGLNLWLELPSPLSGRSLAAECRSRACIVSAESDFHYARGPSSEADSHIRISFGSIPQSRLESAADSIARSALALTSGRRP